MENESQNSYEDSIDHWSLNFKDAELEYSFSQAKMKLELISSSSKGFILVAMIGYFLICGDLILSNYLGQPSYQLDETQQIYFSLLIPIILCELLCFFCEPLASYRGFAWSVLGCIVTLDFSFYTTRHSFYPSFSEE